MSFLRCMFLWSCAAAAVCGCGCGNPDAGSVSGGQPAEQPAATLQSGGVLLDVRSPEEFASGHLRGALNIPHDRIAEEIAAAVPDKTAQVILYCRSGRRAASEAGSGCLRPRRAEQSAGRKNARRPGRPDSPGI